MSMKHALYTSIAGSERVQETAFTAVNKLQVGMKLLEGLEAGCNSGEQSGWLNKDEVLAQFGFEATLDAAV